MNAIAALNSNPPLAPLPAATVRTLSPPDLEGEINAFLSIAADQTGEYWTAEHFLRELPRKWDLSCAAWKDGRPVAYAIVSARSSRHAHLHHFAVAPDMRGQGIGFLMIRGILSRLRTAGFSELTLKVNIKNATARRYYARHSFSEIREEGDYLVLSRHITYMPDQGAAVAIHQPNYLPWLGYFAKIARADVFVFLDDVQFSKNSYTNRVQILGAAGPRWLTIPVANRLGMAINIVMPARDDWARAHLDVLKQVYGDAPAFSAIWDDLRTFLNSAPSGDLASINQFLIKSISERLGFRCRFETSSSIDTGCAAADDRLVRLVTALAPRGTYLSGRGGAKYQDPEKFASAGLEFQYLNFRHPVYEQSESTFVPGLSIVDVLFRMGWGRTAEILAEAV